MLAYFDTTTALHWLGRQLFNRQDPAAFFDPLLERIDPLMAQQSTRARVLSISDETADTKTFLLQPTRRWQGFRAGQHLTITAQINGINRTRTFSVSSSPAQWHRDGTFTITVKRVPQGRVTTWMHNNLKPGAVISIGEAFGDFDLPGATEPALYIAGGSGITPVLSHLESLAEAGYRAPVTLLYYVRTMNDVIAADRLKALSERWTALTVKVYWTDEDLADQKLSDRHLDSVPGLSARRCYMCGPQGLMDGSRDLLHRRNIPEDRIHSASFGAPKAALNSDALGGQVQFESSQQSVDSLGDATLLEIAEATGLSPKYGCRMGICHQCTCRKTSGTVINRLTGKASGPGDESVQLCISVPSGDVSIDL